MKLEKNRVLLAICVALFFVLILVAFTAIADAIVAIIGIIVSLIVFLFGDRSEIIKRALDRSRYATAAMIFLIVVFIVVSASFVFGKRENLMRVVQINGLDVNGHCGLRCIIILENQDETNVEAGQIVAVYGPQSKLENGSWSEAPVGILRIVNISESIIFTQPILVHEASDYDSSRKITTGLRAVVVDSIESDFLTPAFGDGYIATNNVVYLKPNSNAEIGDTLIVLVPDIKGDRVIDQTLSDTRLEIITLGQERISARTKLLSGNQPKEGDIVRLITKEIEQGIVSEAPTTASQAADGASVNPQSSPLPTVIISRPPEKMPSWKDFWALSPGGYEPFGLFNWAYDDSTIEKWNGIGFLVFFVRFIVACFLLVVFDIALTITFGVGNLVYLFLGEGIRNIFFALAAMCWFIIIIRLKRR
jgi:hypothetical protein